MREPPISRQPGAQQGPDRLTGLDGGPAGVAPVLVQVLDAEGSADAASNGDGGAAGEPSTPDAAGQAIAAPPQEVAPSASAAIPAEAAPAVGVLLTDDPVAALRQSISAASEQLSSLQSLRQERDGLQQRCQALEEELEGCRLALQQSQQQLAAAQQQLAEVDALQRQLQQLLMPQNTRASELGDPAEA